MIVAMDVMIFFAGRFWFKKRRRNNFSYCDDSSKGFLLKLRTPVPLKIKVAPSDQQQYDVFCDNLLGESGVSGKRILKKPQRLKTQIQ